MPTRRHLLHAGLVCAVTPMVPLAAFAPQARKDDDPALAAICREMARHAHRLRENRIHGGKRANSSDIRLVASQFRQVDDHGDHNGWKRQLRHINFPTLDTLDANVTTYSAALAARLTAAGLPTGPDDLAQFYRMHRPADAEALYAHVARTLKDGSVFAGHARLLDHLADRFDQEDGLDLRPPLPAVGHGGPLDLDLASQMPPPEYFFKRWLEELGPPCCLTTCQMWGLAAEFYAIAALLSAAFIPPPFGEILGGILAGAGAVAGGIHLLFCWAE